MRYYEKTLFGKTLEKRTSNLIWAIFVAFIIILPNLISDFWTYALCLAGIYSIGTLGLNILTGFTDQVSLGHASFVGIGAYTTAILSHKIGFPFWLTMPSAIFISSLVGFMLGLPCLRLKGLYLAVATLAFAWAIPEIILKWSSLTGGYSGISIETLKIFGISLESHIWFYYITLFILCLLVWVTFNILNSKFGRAFIALRDSEEGAKAMGINISIYKTLAFVLCSAFAGIAGNLYTYLVGTVTPYDFGFYMSIYFLVAVIIGGMGSIPGSILGGAFITFVPLFSSALRNLPNIIYGGMLILVVLLLPGGFYPLVLRASRQSMI
jgi:branched-chain amino acid transport system permease protein